jgi:phosphate transport system substrate-binding protein
MRSRLNALGFFAIAILGLNNGVFPGACLAQNTPATTVSGPATVPGNAAQDNSQHVALMQLVESLEPYHAKSEIKGTAVISGSTTMQSLARAWSERFQKFHPEVSFSKGKDGTESALQEISENPAVIAGASRPLTDAELSALKSKNCKDPMSVIVALDPLALYVHQDNPINSVSPEQIESIFRAATSDKPQAKKWGDLGVKGEWADQPIRIHSRSDVSGTTGFIKQWVAGGAELAKSAQVHETNHDVTKGVGSDKYGVAMSGFGEAIPSVKAVPLVLNGAAIEATEANFLAGRYPLVRPLILIIDKETAKSDQGLREGILRYVLSRDGQLEAIRAGFFPVDPAFIRKQLDGISGPQVR